MALICWCAFGFSKCVNFHAAHTKNPKCVMQRHFCSVLGHHFAACKFTCECKTVWKWKSAPDVPIVLLPYTCAVPKSLQNVLQSIFLLLATFFPAPKPETAQSTSKGIRSVISISPKENNSGGDEKYTTYVIYCPVVWLSCEFCELELLSQGCFSYVKKKNPRI